MAWALLLSAIASTDGELMTGRLAAIDFRCPSRDESTNAMRKHTTSDRCCCRVRCSSWKSCDDVCSAVPQCVHVHRGSSGWGTLKTAPIWWVDAPGVDRCRKLDHRFTKAHNTFSQSGSNRQSIRRQWRQNHCDEYTVGNPLHQNRTGKLVFDIGFHSGDDTHYFLESGHDVIAVDANPAMIDEGVRRPALALAKQSGQLHAIARGVVRHDTDANATLTFYLHNKVTEWSTFKSPSAGKRDEFSPIMVPITTCANLIRQYGVPFYMKVDIEGFDAECLGSLERHALPQYISTEDPLQLDHLLSLGYTSFKMVSQAIARRGGRQFSGGMPEEANGEWGDAASIRSHPFYSKAHMHTRIDQHGNRVREEHDLHARRVDLTVARMMLG